MSVVAVSYEDLDAGSAGSAHPGDQAQARVFEQMLLRELDELGSQAARINEVRRLLDALERRFDL